MIPIPFWRKIRLKTITICCRNHSITLNQYFSSNGVCLQILFFFKRCLSANRIFLQTVFVCKSYFSSNGVCLQIVFFFKRCLSANLIFLQTLFVCKSYFSSKQYLSSNSNYLSSNPYFHRESSIVTLFWRFIPQKHQWNRAKSDFSKFADK